jgi:hypothetical protein
MRTLATLKSVTLIRRGIFKRLWFYLKLSLWNPLFLNENLQSYEDGLQCLRYLQKDIPCSASAGLHEQWAEILQHQTPWHLSLYSLLVVGWAGGGLLVD